MVPMAHGIPARTTLHVLHLVKRVLLQIDRCIVLQEHAHAHLRAGARAWVARVPNACNSRVFQDALVLVHVVAWLAFATPTPFVPLLHRLKRMRRRAFASPAELHVCATTSCCHALLPSSRTHLRAAEGATFDETQRKTCASHGTCASARACRMASSSTAVFRCMSARFSALARSRSTAVVVCLRALRRRSSSSSSTSASLPNSHPQQRAHAPPMAEAATVRANSIVRSHVVVGLQWTLQLHPCLHSCWCVFVHVAMEEGDRKDDR